MTRLQPSEYLVRPAIAEDLGLIFTSWSKGVGRTEPWSFIPRDVFVPAQRAHMERCIDRAGCHVLTPADDADLIWGWSCRERIAGALVVHWLHVKPAARMFGVARALMESAGWKEPDPIVATGWSRQCERAAQRWSMTYNPYIVGVR